MAEAPKKSLSREEVETLLLARIALREQGIRAVHTALIIDGMLLQSVQIRAMILGGL
jgi:hypothetical protein